MGKQLANRQKIQDKLRLPGGSHSFRWNAYSAVLVFEIKQTPCRSRVAVNSPLGSKSTLATKFSKIE